MTEPSASTAGSRRISAFCRTILYAPSASEMVTTAGRASGIAATARLTAVRNMTSIGSPRNTPNRNTTPHRTSAAIASLRPKSARRFWSGVFTSVSSASSAAILPSSVCMPVPTTIPRPRP